MLIYLVRHGEALSEQENRERPLSTMGGRNIQRLGSHLAHLSRLASLLLTWDAGKEIADFTPGTILCLEKSGSVKVKWMLSPRVLKGGG